MPRVNIYIRNEDWEAWNNISDKPEWIHEGLNFGLVAIPPKSIRPDTPIPVSESTRETLRAMSPDVKTCKNGHLLGRDGKCLQKDCKYA